MGAQQGIITGGHRQTLAGLGQWAWRQEAFLFSWRVSLVGWGGSMLVGPRPIVLVSGLFC